MTLGDLEKRVMDVFWKAGTCVQFSVREVLEHINTKNKNPYAYNTILTVITHLFEKKMLQRSAAGKAFVYHATCSKHEFVGTTSTHLFSQLEKEYGALAVAHFVRYMEDVDPKILEEARQLIEKE